MRFEKVIATAGKYAVADENGNRHETVLDAARFNRLVSTHRKLRGKGYSIPTPFDHDTINGIPIRMGNGGVPPALKNAGFLEDLTTREVDGVPALVGVFDVPGDENDPNSLAYKVGKTVKETSIYVRPKFLDGLGELHDEALMHVALVTHPIEPGQSNFKPLKGDLAVAMSQRITIMSGNLSPQIGDTDDEKPEADEGDSTPDAGQPADTYAGASSVAQLVQILRDASINIHLPPDTNEQNFIERLHVAALQRSKQPSSSMMQGAAPPPPPPPMGGMPGMPGQAPGQTPGQVPGQAPGQPTLAGPGAPPQAQQQQPGKPPVNVKKPPKDAVEQPTAIAMSQPTPEVLMSQIEGLSKANQLLAGYVTMLERDKRAARIASLVASGRITQEYADAHLKAQLEGFQMSLGADGKPAATTIDTLLVALENLPARTGSVHNTLVGIPQGAFQHLPAEAQNAIATVLMNMGGSIPAGSVEEGHPMKDFFTGGSAPLTDAAATEVANNFLKNVGQS